MLFYRPAVTGAEICAAVGSARAARSGCYPGVWDISKGESALAGVFW
jgi:hypothetical protein